MTRQQAERIVSRLRARFPRSRWDADQLEVWADEIEEFDFSLAGRTLRPIVRNHESESPPPLAIIRRALVSAREAAEKARAIPPPTPSPQQIERGKQIAQHAARQMGTSTRGWTPRPGWGGREWSSYRARLAQDGISPGIVAAGQKRPEDEQTRVDEIAAEVEAERRGR